MFRFLQVVVTVILLAGVIFLFRKRSRAFVIGLSIILLISSICSGVIIAAIPLPTETVRIEATGEKNSASQGNIIGIKSYIAGGKEYPIEKPVEGIWYYSKDDKAYLWLDNGDERLTEPLTREITIEVPVGASRKLVFLTGGQCGMVQISGNDESKTYDLYGDGAETVKIKITDSDRTYVVFVKLCRLAGYGLLVFASLATALFLAKSVAKEDLFKLLCVVLSIIATLTFYLNFALTDRSGRTLYALVYDFIRSFPQGNYVLAIILASMLYKTFVNCGSLYRENFASVRGTICIALPAGLFAGFMVLGTAFINGENTLRPIFDNELQILKSLFGVVGYFSIFFVGIVWIFHYLDKLDMYKLSVRKWIQPVQWYLGSLSRRPFKTALITLIILYIPYMIASYPAIFMGDTRHHLLQIYGCWTLNNAHPIMSTLFYGFCVKIGILLFGSSNAGLFICSLSQLIFIILIVSFIVKMLFTCGISPKIPVLLILYYIFYPRIHHWMFLLTKDIMSGAFFLLFTITLYMILTGKANAWIYVAFGIADLGVVLFRNDGQYVILISLFLIFITVKKARKMLAVISASTLTFVVLWNGALSWLHVPSTRPGQNVDFGILFCIMSQQTARYVRDAGEEVTAEERKKIDAVFDYEQITTVYEPDDRTDGMMKIIRQSSATTEDVAAYKRVWLQMFAKHPEIYVEATLNHKYQYLYPYKMPLYIYTYPTSSAYMSQVNEEINGYAGEELANFFYPKCLDRFREIYFGVREYFFRIPIFNALYMTSSFFWVLFVWFAYCILRKNKIASAITIPLLVMVLVLIAGPCNGMYFRYSYPYALCLPVLIVLGLHSVKQREFLISDHHKHEHPQI